MAGMNGVSGSGSMSRNCGIQVGSEESISKGRRRLLGYATFYAFGILIVYFVLVWGYCN